MSHIFDILIQKITSSSPILMFLIFSSSQIKMHHSIDVIPFTPKLTVSVCKLHISKFLEYHQTTLSFEISHESRYAELCGILSSICTDRFLLRLFILLSIYIALLLFLVSLFFSIRKILSCGTLAQILYGTCNHFVYVKLLSSIWIDLLCFSCLPARSTLL